MPKRNIIVLLVTISLAVASWLARDRVGLGRRFAEVIGRIEGSYLEPVDRERLFSAAMEGVFAELDEHSAFVAGDRRDRLEAALEGQFGGVGLDLGESGPDRSITVQSPVAGSPAWHAGIAAGDIIRAIDGRPTPGMPLDEATRLLRGRPGTTVVLSIARPADGASREIVVAREIVRVESVLGDRRRPDGGWEWFIEGQPGVALVRISSFGDRTTEELRRAAERIAAGDPDGTPCHGLVLDLRGNSGGTLAAAVDVCDLFLDDGVIVSTRGRDDGDPAADGGLRDVRKATRGAVLAAVPKAVLVDGLTASAAEVVAACLQDHGQAVVVGSRSFGKGTVQTLLPLSDGSGLLKLTTSEYLRPSRGNIHRRGGDDAAAVWGVTPDRGAEITPTGRQLESLAAWRRARDVVPAKDAPVAVGEPTAASHAALPRQMDVVLATALQRLERGSAR
jgi:carboxyl-terminal processing protease